MCHFYTNSIHATFAPKPIGKTFQQKELYSLLGNGYNQGLFLAGGIARTAIRTCFPGTVQSSRPKI